MKGALKDSTKPAIESNVTCKFPELTRIIIYRKRWELLLMRILDKNS
jgi:hypothetical protein